MRRSRLLCARGFAQRRLHAMQMLRKPQLVSFCAEQIRSAISQQPLSAMPSVVACRKRNWKQVYRLGFRSRSSLMCICGRKKSGKTFVSCRENVIAASLRLCTSGRLRSVEAGQGRCRTSRCFSIGERSLDVYGVSGNRSEKPTLSIVFIMRCWGKCRKLGELRMLTINAVEKSRGWVVEADVVISRVAYHQDEGP